jgi:hypothetical protein
VPPEPTPSGRPTPRRFENTTDWLNTINPGWQHRPPADLHGSVSPSEVEAASGHTFTVTLRLGPELTLPAGAHLTLEIPCTWDCHLGNTFRRGVKTLGARHQIENGYGAYADATSSNPAVTLALEVSYGRILDLLDIVVVDGTLEPGDEVRLTLGTEDGNLVQVQKFAQVTVLTTGVDAAGDGTYLRAATHPTVKVVGAAPDRFRVFAPGAVPVGQPFPVRVLPVDVYSNNPAPRYRGTVALQGTGTDATHGGLTIPPHVTFGNAQATGPYGMTAAVATAVTARRGTYTVVALDAERGLIGRSNPIGVDFLSGRGVYFGELHSQMWASMGTGTTEEFFLWGRDVACLDFCAPANHYGRRVEVTDDVWQEMIDTTNRFYEPGRFATLVSYEWGGTVRGQRPDGTRVISGHKNVYYRGDWGPFHQWHRGVHATPTDLWGDLDAAGLDALTVPHHTRAMRGVDWSFRNDRRQRLVEICSQWGISERGGPHSVQAALAMGHRLGFVGGTDSHDGLANQGAYHVNDGNGLACVHATALTREALWDALHERRCYATTGERILLDFTLALDGATHPMGHDAAVTLRDAGARTLRARVAGTATIDRVELLRNNEVIFSAAPGREEFDVTWTDDAPAPSVTLQPTFPDDRPFLFYYLRVTQANRQLAWSSPIWLSDAA